MKGVEQLRATMSSPKSGVFLAHFGTSRNSVQSTATPVCLKGMHFDSYIEHIDKKTPTVDYSCVCRGQQMPGFLLLLELHGPLR